MPSINRSKFAALRWQFWRLHMIEKLSGGTKTNKQTNQNNFNTRIGRNFLKLRTHSKSLYLIVWKLKRNMYVDRICIIQEKPYFYHMLVGSSPLDIHPHIVLLPCHISLGQNSWCYSSLGSCSQNDQQGILKVYLLSVT